MGKSINLSTSAFNCIQSAAVYGGRIAFSAENKQQRKDLPTELLHEQSEAISWEYYNTTQSWLEMWLEKINPNPAICDRKIRPILWQSKNISYFYSKTKIDRNVHLEWPLSAATEALYQSPHIGIGAIINCVVDCKITAGSYWVAIVQIKTCLPWFSMHIFWITKIIFIYFLVYSFTDTIGC